MDNNSTNGAYVIFFFLCGILFAFLIFPSQYGKTIARAVHAYNKEIKVLEYKDEKP